MLCGRFFSGRARAAFLLLLGWVSLYNANGSRLLEELHVDTSQPVSYRNGTGKVRACSSTICVPPQFMACKARQSCRAVDGSYASG